MLSSTYTILFMQLNFFWLAGGHKRSDDAEFATLQTLVNQLVSRVASLEADNSAMKAQLTQLQMKHCDSGLVNFDLASQPTAGSSREQTTHVTFNRPFPTAPAVLAAISSLDSEHAANLRLVSEVRSVGVSGFDLHVREWDDSRNYHVAYQWIACSP